jgi:hypothetical protein
MTTRYLPACLALLLLSCNPEKHDIDKGIQEMSEYKEDAPVEDTVKVDCVFDTSYYKLTMEALRGIPDAKDVQWIETEHTAMVNWRGDEVRRKRGGCTHFSDDLTLISRDTTSLADALHWLERAQQVATHFGLPYFAEVLRSRKVKIDPTMSDAGTSFYRLETEIPEDRVIEGFLIQRTGSTTTLRFEQYQN